MSSLAKAAAEIQALGYEPKNVVLWSQGVIVFDYDVCCGRYKHQSFKIGIGIDEGYPEYPPHFIFVASIDRPKLPVHTSFFDKDLVWSVFSVPPVDFWDTLAFHDKSMKTFFNRHLVRFWSQI